MGGRTSRGVTVVLAALALAGCDLGPDACVVGTASISGDLEPRWHQVLGQGYGGAMHLRDDGSLIVTGLGLGTLTAGGQVIGNGAAVPFVLALDRDGKLLWKRTFEGAWYPRELAVDRAGSVYLVALRLSPLGETRDVDLGQGPIPGSAVLAKLDSNGGLLYGRAVDGFFSPMDDPLGIIRDLQVTMGGPGEVVVTGVSFEGRSFVARCDAKDGRSLSSRVTSRGVSFSAAASDGAGGLLLAGMLNGTFDWGPTTLTSPAGFPEAGSALAFYLDGANRAVWARLLGETTKIGTAAVEGDRGFLGGKFGGALGLDGVGVSALGSGDLMILAVDAVATPAATLTPLAIVPAGDSDGLAALAPDGAGGVMALGDARSSLDLGGVIAPPGSEFLLHLDGAGRRLAHAELPASLGAGGLSVARDGNRSYAFGVFGGAIALGGRPWIPPTPNFSNGLYVAAFGPGFVSTTSVPCPPAPETLAAAAPWASASISDLALAGDKVIMASEKDLMSIPAAGGSPRLLAISQKRISGLAVWGDRVLWSNLGTWRSAGPPDDGSIMMMPLAGGQQTVLASGRNGPLGVATDGNYAYWTEGGEVMSHTSITLAGRVMAVPLAGGAPAAVATGLDWVGPIAAGEGFVVFAAGSGPSSGQIVRVAKGLGERVVLGLTETTVSSLAIAGGNVYWAESLDGIPLAQGSIHRVPLGGGVPVLLARQETAPRELAVANGQLYWLVDGVASADTWIVRMPVDGGPVTTLEASSYLGALSVDRSQMVWTASDAVGNWALRARSLQAIQSGLDRTAADRRTR